MRETETKETGMRDEGMVLEAYKLARIYAPKVCARYNSKNSSEDLVQEFIANFMEKDFGAKFDVNTTSLNHYVWLGLRNVLVSGFRKGREFLYNDSVVSDGEGEKTSIFDLIADNRPVTNLFSNLLKEEILERIADTQFGYDVVAEVNGKAYPSTVRSIVELFLSGFTVTEISKKFQTTAARVGQLLREAVLDLPAELVYA